MCKEKGKKGLFEKIFGKKDVSAKKKTAPSSCCCCSGSSEKADETNGQGSGSCC